MQISWGDEWSKVCSSSKLLSWHLHFPNFMSALLNRLLSPFGSDSTWLVVVLQSRLWLLVCTHSHTNQKERKKEKKTPTSISSTNEVRSFIMTTTGEKRSKRVDHRKRKRAGGRWETWAGVCVCQYGCNAAALRLLPLSSHAAGFAPSATLL